MLQSIDLLEFGGGPLTLIHNGEYLELPDPRGLHFQKVLMAIDVGHAPGTPGDLPEWKRRLVFERWCAAWGLPTDFRAAQRLAYLVDHYRSAITHDLAVYTHRDLGELWRSRQWVTLLDILDHLPGHSQFATAISMDSEHAKMVAESILASGAGSGGESAPSAPSLATWSPEVAMMARVVDAVNSLRQATIAVNGGDAPQAEPVERPKTALDAAMSKARYESRRAKHEALVARLLPNRG